MHELGCLILNTSKDDREAGRKTDRQTDRQSVCTISLDFELCGTTPYGPKHTVLVGEDGIRPSIWVLDVGLRRRISGRSHCRELLVLLVELLSTAARGGTGKPLVN